MALKLEYLNLSPLWIFVQNNIIQSPLPRLPACRLASSFELLVLEGGDCRCYNRMQRTDNSPSSNQKRPPPREGARRYEQDAGQEEQDEKYKRRERFVGKVGKWRQDGNQAVVNDGKVLHAILKISHVAKEVLAHLWRRLHAAWHC